MGNYHEYTDEDAKKYFAEITKKNAAKEKPFFIRSKKFIAASVAVILIFLGGFTVYASSPVVKDWVHKVLNFDIGQAFVSDKITYIYSGEITEYSSIEELINGEALNILYPKKLLSELGLTSVNHIESENKTYFKFDNPQVQFTITHNTDTNEEKFKNAEKIYVNDYIFFIVSKNDLFIAYSIINNDLYSIQCNSKENLLKMINNFE